MSEQERLAQMVAEIVYGKIAGTFTDFMTNIERGQTGIATDIERIKEALHLVEGSYVRLDEQSKLMGHNVDDIRDMIPDNFRDDFWQLKDDVKGLKAVSSKKTIRKRVIVTIAVAVISAIVIILLILLTTLPWFHKHILERIGYENKDAKELVNQLHEGQARDKGTTRSGRYLIYSEIQQDSIREETIQGILKTIKNNN